MTAPDPTDEWVKKLNDLARRMFEWESSLHPSCWPEAMATEIQQYKNLAKAGPKE